MKPYYDYVFVTHLPAFYKVNLYREIAKKCRVLVIFMANGSAIRTHDFIGSLEGIESITLYQGAFEQRKRRQTCVALFKIMRSIRYHTLVLGGWDLIEYWWLALCSPRKKNALALESSVHDSRHRGWLSWIKRLYLKKMTTVFASGEPHEALLHALGYKGKIVTTRGVGIFNYVALEGRSSAKFEGRFLYVGRLSAEKNIQRLLDVFRQLPQYTLTIVGQGPLLATLQKNAPSNVKWRGHIPNRELGRCYQEHDLLILPSLKEPWGVVVEEALYYGLPVIASERVGCAREWIERYQVGILCDPLDHHSIEDAILWAVSRYDVLRNQIKRIDFSLRDRQQVQQYIKVLS